MGFGLPAALGAKLAAPHRPVVAIIGDGGFATSGLELLTAVREKLPVVLVVFNDGRLNRIRIEQLERFGATEGVDLVNPDFEAIAAALGVHYSRCGPNLPDAVRAAMSRDGPTLIEVPMGDSLSFHAARARGLVRAAARGALGRGARWPSLRALFGGRR
jgi:thiamine pyrophosphate-dependent acetolactate synthase large subunit-like protein